MTYIYTLKDETLINLITKLAHSRLDAFARAIGQTFAQLTRIIIAHALIL
jgi:hypothetical protein